MDDASSGRHNAGHTPDSPSPYPPSPQALNLSQARVMVAELLMIDAHVCTQAGSVLEAKNAGAAASLRQAMSSATSSLALPFIQHQACSHNK